MNDLANDYKRADPAATQVSQPGEATLSDVDLLRTEIEALRRQNAIMREALDTIEGSVVVYDRERRYLLGNKAYHSLYPHLPGDDELIGRKYEELLALSIAAGSVDNPVAYTDPAAFIMSRIASMEQRGKLSRETQNARPGRESLHPQTGRWSLVRSKRTPSGSDVSLRVDITAQKRLQEELQEARAAAEKASQMKSQFLSNISHELRTPLNAVINFAQLLVEQIHGPLGAPQYRDYARDIAESGVHLLTLIDELLDLARAEAGRLTIAEGVVDVGRSIGGVCRVLKPEADAAGVTLLNESDARLRHLRGDPMRFRQILFNLIGNAIKFTRAGGTVSVEAWDDPKAGLSIVVQDTGIGIAGPNLDRVMEPFAQVAVPSGNSRPGVGLGLPLSRHLIELHGGTLSLDSTEGVGTTVTLRLPVGRMMKPSQVMDQPT
jgi:signal transduction histidine kinase